MKQLSKAHIQAVKRAVFWLCLLPFLWLLAAALTRKLGADPVAGITRATGIWSLRLLMAVLALTPLRKWTGWQWLACLRRTVALYAFFYAALHLLAYVVFEQYFDWPEIAKDIQKRPYIAAGFLSFVLMVPLAVTSTNGMMKRMGGRNWQLLHRLTYVLAAAAVLHYFWLVKQDTARPALYAVVLSALLCARLAAPSRGLHPRPKPSIGLEKRSAG